MYPPQFNNSQRMGTSFYGQNMSPNYQPPPPNNMNYPPMMQNSNNYPNQNHPSYNQNNPNYNNQNPQQQNNQFGNQSQYNRQNSLPNYQLLKRGQGIDENEFNTIIWAAGDALQKREDPLSDGITRRIKSRIGGEWFAFASVQGLKGFDFSLSIVTGSDFLSFNMNGFQFEVCRLRD